MTVMMAEPGMELQLITKLKGSLSRISGREWLTGNVSHDNDKNGRIPHDNVDDNIEGYALTTSREKGTVWLTIMIMKAAFLMTMLMTT